MSWLYTGQVSAGDTPQEIFLWSGGIIQTGTHTLSGKETSFHLFTEVFLPGHDLGARNVRQGNRFSFSQQKEIKENEGSFILLHSLVPDADLHHHCSRPVVWPKRIHCTVGGSNKAVFAALATGGGPGEGWHVQMI